MFFKKKSLADKTGEERDAKWYSYFVKKGSYHLHYTQSNYYFLWTVIADRLKRGHVRDVLEIACGTGQLANLLNDKGLQNYTGFDFCPEFIQIAKQNVPHFTFMVDDALKTTLFEDVRYDCVIATEFLEHINDDIGVLRKIMPGTRVIASVPNFAYPSHVRHFTDVGEVRRRYESLFEQFDVDYFYKNEKPKTFFILDGIIK